MNQTKKSFINPELAKIVKSGTSIANKRQSIDFGNKKIQLNSYFTPNSFCGKRNSAQKFHNSNSKHQNQEPKKGNSISQQKDLKDLKKDFFSSANFCVKKFSGNFITNCFNSTLSNVHQNSKTEIFVKGSLKKKTQRNSVSKSKNQSSKNISFFKDNRNAETHGNNQFIMGTNSPVGIANIQNFNNVSSPPDKNHKKSNSNIEDNFLMMKNLKPIAKNLQTFFANTKVMNKIDSSKMNHENTIKNWMDGSNQKSAKKRFSDIENSIQGILNLKPKVEDESQQKNFSNFYQINFSSTNINSLIKDIAKSKLVKKFLEEKQNDSKVQNSRTMKYQIMKECISMTQEQLFFEELLQILGEKGVDIENLFAYCYERLKIDTNISNHSMKNSNFKILSDSFSCLNSEISVLEDASYVLKKDANLTQKKRKLQIDMKNVKQEIFSSNDEN